MKSFLIEDTAAVSRESSPVWISPEALGRVASRSTTIMEVVNILQTLESDAFTKAMADTLKRGAELLGDDWGYVDITNALYAISKLGRPENYLEIGVRRGRSMCMVVAATPTVNVVGFDVWQDNYAGNENPGETLVKAELAKFGHSGRATFIGGDSRVTVRDYLSKHPDLTFDLMTVDGDHSAEGAIFDLESVVDRLRVGGVLLFDDLDNPHCLDLNAVWDRFTAKYSNLRCHKIFNPLGFGVAIAVKTSTLVGTVSGRSKWFGR